MQVGDIIYGRVVLPNKDMEPELSCTEEAVPKQGYGVIHTDGYLFQCSLNLARRYVNKSNVDNFLFFCLFSMSLIYSCQS